MAEYQIRVRGHLPANWSDFVAGAQPRNLPGGECLIVAELPDQAALYGLLSHLSDLGLHLLSVNPTEEVQALPRV